MFQRRVNGRGFRLVFLGLSLALLVSCATRPPAKHDDLCSIYEEKRSWYKAGMAMQKKWDVPVSVPMAIMYQESGFVANAKAPRTYTFFGLIPWGRKSSAYGYPQALDGTWDHYRDDTDNAGADRDDFADALDFMGWYIHNTRRLNGVSATDAYKQYLNYHEGWQGYRQGRWKNTSWLKKVAQNVARRAGRYDAQFAGCRDELAKGFWYRLFH